MDAEEQIERETLFPAFGLGLGAAVGLGFARFSYALLLPSMREDMNWTYAVSGSLNTANALGYVAGSLSAYVLLQRARPSYLFMFGLVATCLAVLTTGLSSNLIWLMANRFLAGVFAAWVLTCGAALVAARYNSHLTLRKVAIGIFFSGAGIGIAVSGVVVNPIIAISGAHAWHTAWLALGVASVIASVWSLLEAKKIEGQANSVSAGNLKLLGLKWVLFAYFLFACGYIVYMTFIFAWIQASGMSWEFATSAWTLLGGAVALSPFIWRRALDSWNPAATLAACCSVTLLGTLIPTIVSSAPGILLSACLFGLGMFIAPSCVAILVQRTMVANQWAKGITLFTAVFSIGQAIGPVCAGWIADGHGLGSSLFVGSGLLGAASCIALVGKQRVAARCMEREGAG